MVVASNIFVDGSDFLSVDSVRKASSKVFVVKRIAIQIHFHPCVVLAFYHFFILFMVAKWGLAWKADNPVILYRGALINRVSVHLFDFNRF